MQQNIVIKLLHNLAKNETEIIRKIGAGCKCNPQDINGYIINKRSIDARGKSVIILLSLTVFINEKQPKERSAPFTFNNVRDAKNTTIIIGAGPAGLFAALQLIELGIKPIILERGKDVKSRRRDLATLNKTGAVNPESNYCFGEGGAGTYSDGKLYTRSQKRGSIQKVLELFCFFGAPENILYDAHPHIGTNKLPQIIVSMREKIIECGGEVHFDTKITDIKLSGEKMTEISTATGESFIADAYLLATGHSARDIFELFVHKNLLIEQKPFALGVRVEHPQHLINQIQYGEPYEEELTEDAYLPPASYSLVQQVDGRGVFSFCMCPGGIIAAAATAPGEIVVNGWSPSKRNNPYANSGMVVQVNKEDILSEFPFLDPDDPLLFLKFQQIVEQKAFEAGGGASVAPAQRLIDFVNQKVSATLPKNSYTPGVHSTNLHLVLPSFVYKSLAGGFKAFGKKLKGYYTNEAIVLATESRTSSPVRIPRDEEGLFHPQAKNLFPCGEGAGYAGGIVSAAMDGQRVALAIASNLTGQTYNPPLVKNK